MNNNDNDNNPNICNYIYVKFLSLFNSLSYIDPENNFRKRQNMSNHISKIIDRLPPDFSDKDLQKILTQKQFNFYKEYM